MREEAEANAEADKEAKEKVEKVNAADTLIFQTEKQLKEYGDKLSEGNKQAVDGALAELKEAHSKQDVAAIDAAMNKLNEAWNAASQEIYQAQGGADAAGAADGNTATGGGEAADGDVSDVEYEEVNDKDKK
jgi:molecular chaperone DnaK